MKKIIIIFISVVLLTNCRSKKRVVTHRTIVKDHSKTVVKPIDGKSEVYVNTPLYIDVSENKTFFDKNVLDVIYANKPNLMTAKVDYIKKYSELAIHEMEVYKIPASITLAQGLLESRYGKSLLTKKAKNHFGIKCHKWKGDRVYHDDDEKGECFRKYQMHESSYRDHSLFLSHKKRYAKLFTFELNDYKSWAKGLRKAGYATDKKYPQKLIALIEEYELYYFDTLVLGEAYVSKEEVENEPVKVNNQELIANSKFHIVKTGETLYSISRKLKIPVSTIKKLNNLDSNEIAIGKKLQLFEPNEDIVKIKESTMLVEYTVKTGDTIYSIARNNRITVAKLKQLNKLESDNISIGQLLIIKK